MVIQRVITNASLDQIDDNPYNPRSHYPRNKIDELAESIKAHGLLELPKARPKGGRFQLAFGSLRKRAFDKLAREDAEKWGTMPLELSEISDDEMFYYAIEENLKRADLTPIEVAQGINAFLEKCPEVTEEKLGKALRMSEANVSNMRRVLRLPQKFLDKIDEGAISFTQGRELLTMEELPNAENLMSEALRGLKTGDKQWGEPNTVDGLQKSIHSVINNHFPPLDKEWSGYRYDLLFDTRAAGCLECQKMIRTHPTKSQAAHFCSDEQCWQKKQAEHRQKAAVEAKAKMEAEILKIASGDFSQEKLELPAKRKPMPVAIDTAGVAVHVPCDSCAKADSCDRTHFHVAADRNDQLVCEEKVERMAVPEEAKAPPVPEIPEDILALAKEKAGTRAEVLDLNDICSPGYYRQVKQGYAILDDELRLIDAPQECLERCTHGFHYTFDSKAKEQKVLHVCSDTKCLAKKKGAFTRKKNAEGQARKNAERQAIQEALASSGAIGRQQIKVILLAQVKGSHITKYYYGDGTKSPDKWLWDKVSAGTKNEQRTQEALFKKLDSLAEDALARLLVEMMLYYLQDHGDIGSWEIKTELPLSWLGVEVKSYLPAQGQGDKGHA